MGRGPGHGLAFLRLVPSLPSEEVCPKSSEMILQRGLGRIGGVLWHCRGFMVPQRGLGLCWG